MKKIGSCIFFYFPLILCAQSLNEQLTAAVNSLQQDEQFKHAAIGMYVVDAKTGQTIFDKNAATGLVPASCQKIITSAAAFSLLNKEYHFKTRVYLQGTIQDTILLGGLLVEGSGDPTLGSTRFSSTKNEAFFKNVLNALKEKGIKKMTGDVTGIKKNFAANNIAKGWVWEDIGNYYGAAAAEINWQENKYSIFLTAGNETGKPVKFERFEPVNFYLPLANHLLTAEKGSGDNAYIYIGLNNERGNLVGTIPAGVKDFEISGAVPNPVGFFEEQFNYFLRQQHYTDSSSFLPGSDHVFSTSKNRETGPVLYEATSPSLDSINYWFLKKSVNLYGEAFVKAIAFEKEKSGSTEKGIDIIKDFWNKNGIEKSALNIIDGSGLSPANRVTTKALVTVLLFAKQQSWFTSFYNALPEMNGIKMKDGYIGGVRAYTGYVKSKNGTEYIFSFIANNFDGSAATAREKMWQVLNLLK